MTPLFPLLALLFLLAPSRADSLLLTELVADPQSDHSESAGGNGVPFDALPGSGTVSSVDEYVEIFNPCPNAVDLRGHRLEFLDSTPSAFVFGVSSGGVLRFSPGSNLEGLAPGGFALLGNPPGAVNNRVTVRLLDPRGTVLDAIPDADANATGLADEALARVYGGGAFGGRFVRDVATPLAPSTPVPEPATAWLLAVSALLAGAASARRARRARRRRPPAA